MKHHEKIYKYLIAAVLKGYSDGIKDISKLTIKYVRKFSDNSSNLFDIRWTSKDEELLSIFRKECFTVALIGEYELQEKLKELAIKVQKEMPQGGWKLNGKSISPQNLFAAASRQLIGNYTGGDSDKIPPAGWLRTNINTANSSAYHAAEYQRLQQVSDIYPYYKYMTRHDERVRPAHSSLHGKIFRYNDPIWKSIWPPNGWNCRCYVTPMTLEEMQAEGTYVPPVEAEHHRTEFIKTVPEEFRRNPGIEEHIFTKWAEQKFKDMPKEKAEEIKRKVEEFSKINTVSLSVQEFNEMYKLFVNSKIIKNHLTEVGKTKDFDDILKKGKKLGLTTKETIVINSYTSRPFANLNKALRENENVSKDLMSFNQLLNHSLNKLPNFMQTSYRGVGTNLDPNIDFKIFEKWEVNTIQKEKGFMSTSRDKNVYPHRNIEFIIKGKNGKLIEMISNESQEREVLFQSGTNFKVIKKYFGKNEIFNTKKLFIELQEI